MATTHHLVPGAEEFGAQLFQCEVADCGRKLVVDARRRRLDVLVAGDQQVVHEWRFPGLSIDASIDRAP